jgi:hypothetical protein
MELHAPRLPRPIAIDAEDGKPAWESDVGGTGVLKDDAGRGMVPFSEARVRWGEGILMPEHHEGANAKAASPPAPGPVLYLWLYAGDLDLEGNVREADGPVLRDDAFHIELGGDRLYTVDVSVLGTVADAACTGAVGKAAPARSCDAAWQSGAVVAVDRDGTLNKLGDNDEEWIVEMAIPLASIGLAHAGAGTHIPFAVKRCEIGQSKVGACGAFGEGTTRAEIVLESTTLDAPAARADRTP